MNPSTSSNPSKSSNPAGAPDRADAPRQPVAWRQRALVLCAVLAGTPALYLDPSMGAFCAVIALPALARSQGLLRTGCRWFAWVLIFFGLVGALFGLFFFIPSAVVLLCAAAARPGAGPLRTAVAVTVAGLLTVPMVGLSVVLTSDLHLRETHAFRSP